MESKDCDFCEIDFVYSDEDEFYLSEVIEGQYVEIRCVNCPMCSCANQLY